MFCAKCGTAIPAEYAFCASCGSPVPTSPPQGVVQGQRRVMSRAIRPLLVALVAAASLAAVFAIALGVTEWRTPNDNSDLIASLDAAIGRLESQIDRVDSRLSVLESPLPVADRDIQELYAGLNYDDCTTAADVELADYDIREDEAFRNYVVGAITYAQYQGTYDAYSAAYDRRAAAYDDCWDTYIEESPFQ